MDIFVIVFTSFSKGSRDDLDPIAFKTYEQARSNYDDIKKDFEDLPDEWPGVRYRDGKDFFEYYYEDSLDYFVRVEIKKLIV